MWSLLGTGRFPLSSNWLSVQRVKACVGGPPRQPSWGCSQLCRPLWGCQTVPTIHWQQSPAGGISDSFGSAHSCRNRRECAIIVNHFSVTKELLDYSCLSYHLTIYQCISDRSCVHRAEWGQTFRPCRYNTPPRPSAASLCTDTQTKNR